MTKALFIIDVQNDFTEGGALGVEGGSAVAEHITKLLDVLPDRYDYVFASRDWHDADNDNGGHFAAEPDYVDSWPSHCVAGTSGAEYHPSLNFGSYADKVIHVRKGQGEPAYSIFEGTTDDGTAFTDKLTELGVTDVDVVGIATDYCVRASALDAWRQPDIKQVTVFRDMIAGVHPESSLSALRDMYAAGINVTYATSRDEYLDQFYPYLPFLM